MTYLTAHTLGAALLRRRAAVGWLELKRKKAKTRSRDGVSNQWLSSRELWKHLVLGA